MNDKKAASLSLQTVSIRIRETSCLARKFSETLRYVHRGRSTSLHIVELALAIYEFMHVFQHIRGRVVACALILCKCLQHHMFTFLKNPEMRDYPSPLSLQSSTFETQVLGKTTHARPDIRKVNLHPQASPPRETGNVVTVQCLPIGLPNETMTLNDSGSQQSITTVWDNTIINGF